MAITAASCCSSLIVAAGSSSRWGTRSSAVQSRRSRGLYTQTSKLWAGCTYTHHQASGRQWAGPWLALKHMARQQVTSQHWAASREDASLSPAHTSAGPRPLTLVNKQLHCNVSVPPGAGIDLRCRNEARQGSVCVDGKGARVGLATDSAQWRPAPEAACAQRRPEPPVVQASSVQAPKQAPGKTEHSWQAGRRAGSPALRAPSQSCRGPRGGRAPGHPSVAATAPPLQTGRRRRWPRWRRAGWRRRCALTARQSRRSDRERPGMS